MTVAERRIALFFTKAYSRVLRRGLARLDVPAPNDVSNDPFVRAWNRFDAAVSALVGEANLGVTM